MTISAILSLVVWRNIAEPVKAFAETTRRAELVASAETALARIDRELRTALPNSVRVTPGGTALEFLRTTNGGRYRAEVDVTDATSDAIALAASADSFNVLGGLATDVIPTGGAGGTTACMAGAINCVAIYNTGVPADCAMFSGPRSNAYCGDNLAGVVGYDAGTRVLSFARGVTASAWPAASPYQRFFIVDTPVTLNCGEGRLRRYANYPINATQRATPAGAASDLAARVESCEFTYDPGTATRQGLVTVRLVLASDNLEGAREAITLLQQIPIANAP